MNIQGNNLYRYPNGRLATTSITNGLAEEIERLRPLQPGGGPADNRPYIYRPVWLVKVGEQIESEGEDPVPIEGKYHGKLIDESTLKNIDTGDLEEATLGTVPDEDNCIVWDLRKLASIGAGVCVGSDADGKPIIVMHRPLIGELFVVGLDQDGGADGDGSSAATWTYTATTLDDVELGTSLSPQRPRDSYGQREPASMGTGYYDPNGDFKLAEAWETIPVEPCED